MHFISDFLFATQQKGADGAAQTFVSKARESYTDILERHMRTEQRLRR